MDTTNNTPPTTPPAPAHVTEFAENELAGFLLQTCVVQLEQLKTPWALTSEDNQQIAINKMRENIENAVTKAVGVIATNRRPVIAATVKSVNFDDGIKAVLTLSRHEVGRHALADAQGSQVTIILISANEFNSGTEKVKAEPNQPSLALEVGATEPTTLIPDSIPEIRENADGTFTIYKDQMPMPGGKGFGSQQDAETWLQKQLGVGKDKPADPPIRDEAAEAKKLAGAVKMFTDAGEAEGKKKNGDWDTGWNAVCEKYDATFVDENYAELSKAYADGFEKSQE